jgi:GTP-binding protein Era
LNQETNIKCGFVAIVGRPNVGKSTLLNTLLQQKVSIISRKPQTTRHRILGIKTENNQQIIYVDTPGIHINQKKAINRYLNKTAFQSLLDVDVVLFVFEALVWTEEDEMTLQRLKEIRKPIIAIVNKIDKIKEKERLLPYLAKIGEKFEFTEVVPISARQQKTAELVESIVAKYLPESDTFYFPEEMVTDRSLRFMVAELIREKLLEAVGQEVPHSITIEIEEFDESNPELTRIGAIIWVENDGQKPIVIGAQGKRLKEVGRLSRIEIEGLVKKKVFLRLWVKVRGAWSDDERALRSLGFTDE